MLVVFWQMAAYKGNIMKTKTKVGCVISLALVAGWAVADDTDALIELDKKWGGAAGSEGMSTLLTDDVIAVDTDGVAGKAEMLAAAQAAGAPSGAYVAGDYKVNFLSDKVAVMVHSAPQPEPHWSMHVWQKVDGKWQVAATATVPIDE
jgi:hypothetical protein